jgi:L-ascorbate metabolism protein UlaG (beta-lactamase superfamily)
MMNRRTFFAACAALPALTTSTPPGGQPTLPISVQSASRICFYKPRPDTWSDDTVTVAWIGHSTILIKMFGVTVLTDPVLFDRVGLYLFGTTFGLTRFVPPALPFEQIPKPDVVLISHAHLDHCDYYSLKQLTERHPNAITAIVAANTRDVVESLAWKSVVELDWHHALFLEVETPQEPRAELVVRALPVKHVGWRLPGDLDRAQGSANGRSFNAYLLEHKGKRIVFGGDTAYTETFADLGSQLAAKGQHVDIAMMPIGAYFPWRTVHCTPEEALQMSKAMRAAWFVPMHCNTFPLGREATHEPLKRLRDAFSAQMPPSGIQLAFDTIGKTFVLPNTSP